MNKYWKAGVLAVTLVLPALLILLLNGAASNHYDLPYYVPKIDSTSGNVVMNGADTVFHTVPAFSLTDQSGQVVTEKTVKGKLYVADFIFTRCNTICPKLTSKLGRIQKEFADKGVLILSHTIDPEYDTPEVLQGYAQNNAAQPGVWYFLTGSKAQLYNLATRGYYVAAREETSENNDPNQTISHSDKLILVDKEGHIRGFYSGTDPAEIDRLRAEIKVLLDIYQKKDGK